LAYLPEVEAKLFRADSLIEELREELEPYLSTKNFFVEKTKIEPNIWELTLRMHSQPPMIIGAKIGDVVHNLRSSLDVAMYLSLESVFQMKFSQLTDYEKKNICFPIFDNEDRYRDSAWSSNLADEPLLNGLSEIQPFRNLEFAGNDAERQLMLNTAPLRELHSLWNQDKHRGVHLVVGGLDMLALGLNADESAEWKMIDPPPWVDGSKPFQILYKNAGPQETLNLTDSFAIGLPSDVRPLQVYPVIDKLKWLRNHVEFYHSILAHWCATRKMPEV
jgi:hypothetical protein